MLKVLVPQELDPLVFQEPEDPQAEPVLVPVPVSPVLQAQARQVPPPPPLLQPPPVPQPPMAA
jgi:hypothetical protein